MTVLIPLAVTVPFVFAAALVIVGHVLPTRATDVVGITAAATGAVLTAIVFARSFSGLDVYWFGGWHPRGNVALGIGFAVDGFGAGLALLVLALTAAVLVYSWRYMEEAHYLYEVLMLLFGGAMAAFALSGDLFNMFVFFELMSVTAFALTAYRVEEQAAIQSAFNFAVTNTLGGFLVVTGLALLYARTGALNLAQIGQRLTVDGRHDGLVVVAFALIVCGFLVKAAIVPFHFWMADAYATAPAPVCVLFAGAMSDLGIYAIARVYWTVFDGPLGDFQHAIRDVLLGAGAVTAILAAVMCTLQRHLKRLLAYSTISDLGLLLMGVALLTPDGLAGTATFVLAHSLAKGALFLVGGMLLAERGSIDELELYGRCRGLPWSAVAWGIGALALASPPFLGTFQGHALIGDSASALGYWWVPLVLSVATAVSTAAIVRSGVRVFLGGGDRTDPLLSEEPEEGPGDRREVPSLLAMRAVALTLAVGGLAVGAFTFVGANAKEAAHQFEDRGAYVAKVLDETPVPPSPAQRWETTTESVVWSLATLFGSLALALVGLYRSRAPKAAVRAFVRVVAPLRAAHSGHVGDYVAWLTLGTAVIGGLFAVTIR